MIIVVVLVTFMIIAVVVCFSCWILSRPSSNPFLTIAAIFLHCILEKMFFLCELTVCSDKKRVADISLALRPTEISSTISISLLEKDLMMISYLFEQISCGIIKLDHVMRVVVRVIVCSVKF